jgi:predicted DNA-binding transcriptional regulator AlpA
MTKLKRRFRMKELPALTGYAASTIYQKVQRGEFPKPHRISRKVAIWTEDQILEFQRSQGFKEECDA